ncbi:trehalose operon repressor [Clostridium intestinale]|uniref:Trehalose operon repressor n=1 Tax=Clostridium intestinale URNW TaxID=1294142 RepID=U2PY47_9CLOT|nr:trehalose operon repressor [Clostridium intestinale]ERK28719.1 trehalose operon repressor [Clostridium intestinale URNW]
MNSKYITLYNKIIEKIEQGSYPPSSKLPSENELMEKYKFSRDTVRKALNMLEHNGYINKVKGKGSFVLDINRHKFPVSGLISFKEMAESMEGESKTLVKSLELTKGDKFLRSKLVLEDDEKLWNVVRVREIGGKKIILDKDHFNSTYIPELTKEICRDSIYDYIEKELGLKIGFAKKEITVRSSSEEDIEYLDLEGYDMVVVVDTMVYLQDGTLFQYTESRHRPDKFKFVDFARRAY